MDQPESQTQPQQQSWAAWLLDAYANAVVTEPHEDHFDDSTYESMSPTMSESSNMDSSSPYGPYVRTGRGGAGNFQWESQQPKTDVEVQKPMTLKEKRNVTIAMDSIDTAAAARTAQSKKPAPFVRAGRGGAGNFSAFVQSNSPQPSPTSAKFPKSPSSANSPAVYSGRGGAGNFAASKTASEQARIAKEKLEQEEAAKRREQALLQVESLLQPPSQAYTGTSRRSALPEELENHDWE